MPGFLDKRRKRKLYEQWVEKSGLPPEDIPQDTARDEPESSVEEAWPEGAGGKSAHSSDSFFLRIRVRYIFVLGFIFALLLIAISVLSTILVMQSC